MTLLNIYREADKIHIVSDGAATSESGVISSFCSKTYIFPHLSAAIVVRGVLHVAGSLALGLNVVGSFDQLRERLPGILRSQIDVLAANGMLPSLGGEQSLEIDVGVVGWSESENRPVGYFVSSLQGRSAPPPFELVEVDNLITPSTDQIYRDLSPAMASPAFDVAKDMITVAEHQRSRALELRGVDQVPVSLVGGSGGR